MSADSLETPSKLRWHQSLRWPLLSAGLLIALLFAAASYFGNERLVIEPLREDADRQSARQADHAETALRALLTETETLASALAVVATRLGSDSQALRAELPKLVAGSPLADEIAAFGFWPAPGAFRRGVHRHSLKWLRSSDGVWQLRTDWNDPANVSWHAESWYTPTAWTAPGRCVWSDLRREPLSGRLLVTCSVPMRSAEGFHGAVTVSLTAGALAQRLHGLTERGSYALVFDRSNQLLYTPAALVGSAAANVAELAQRQTAYAPLALALHDINERAVRHSAELAAYRPEAIDHVHEKSRDLPRLDVQLLLAGLWLAQSDESPPAAASLSLAQDPVIGDAATLGIRALPGSLWKLAVGTPRRGSPALREFGELPQFGISAGAVVGAALLLLLFADLMLVRPLRRLTGRVLRPADEDSPLADGSHGEIAVLAKAFDQRAAQLRALDDRLRAALGSLRRSSDDDSRISALPTAAQGGRLERALRSMSDALLLTDSDGNVQFMNRAAEVIAGIRLDEAQGKTADEVLPLLDSEQRRPMRGLVAACLESGRGTEQPVHAYLETRGGHQLPVAVAISAIREGKNVSGSTVLVQDARALFERLKDGEGGQSVDPLTGLRSRLAFDTDLARLADNVRLGATTAATLLYLDVDKLSQINDGSGTDAGDEFLRQFARLLEGSVGPDHKLYRLGGDRFAALMDIESEAESEAAAELVRADVESWGFQWKGESFETSVSGGLVMVTKDAGRPLEILKSAETACQEAKTQGRNRIELYHAAPMSRTRRRDDQVWIDHIRRGLAEDCFHLSTQMIKPMQRDLAQDGEIFEILLLLEDEEGFWAAASAFMPAAERYHLATELDRWVIRRIFEQLAGDSALMGRISMCSINLSGQSIEENSFIDFLVSEVESSRVDPRKLCFEITERAINARLATAREFIHTLKQLGCRICVEDFTSGMAGAGLLKELPVDMIKLAPSLTRRITEDNADRLAVESLHKIAHLLHKRTIATQIESQEALHILQGIGIDYVQGYAVAKPSPMLFSNAA